MNNMEKKQSSSAKRSAIKISLMALISLLLLIPLAMVESLIEDREDSMETVAIEVANSYAEAQIVYAPELIATSVLKNGENKYYNCKKLDYKVSVDTDVLHRSICDVIVYRSKIDISGNFKITAAMINAKNNHFKLDITDFKGLASLPTLSFGGKTYNMTKSNNDLLTIVNLPEGVKIGDLVEFNITLDLKGTDALTFQPNAAETTLNISSTYPHPSFKGDILPTHRDVRSDGFEATWSVLDMNINSAITDTMGVEFINPANPYQQATRSAKYGILVIILVFVAGLLAELISGKEISPIQYAIIGLSLVLFYSLLLSFSEFIAFGWAYVIAALMTTTALTLYFKGILKSRNGYTLGGFVALVYIVNYMLLQMETYALLAGSLVLFVLLCVVMYMTTTINTPKELIKTESDSVQ